MKKLCLYLVLVTAGFGQWIVHDPVNTAVAVTTQANQLAQHAEILRQWAAEIGRLEQQVRVLQDQLEIARQVRAVAGDPKAAGAGLELGQLGVGDLTQELGRTLAELRARSSAAESLQATADGVFAPLEDRTSLGIAFERQALPYRRFAAVEQAAANLEQVRKQAGERRIALQRAVAAALVRLKDAGTQAEVDKLQGEIAALNGQLAVVEAQERVAAGLLQSQQILNENQAAKETQDLLEKRVVEEQAAIAQLGRWQEGIRLSAGGYGR
ncbi:MAG: hypothetical protein JSR48_00325 [Verrucomicrobia bacterium]|nr:hypothetical protein [Verrucomicrobiota bacterium]